MDDGRALAALALFGLIAGHAVIGSRGVVRTGRTGVPTAEQIATRYGNDGAVWLDADGIRLLDVIRATGARKIQTTAADANIWVFSDGSALATTPEGWDIVIPIHLDNEASSPAWISTDPTGGPRYDGWLFREKSS